MASREAVPHAGVIVSGRLDEHAALVALLQGKPDGLSWQKITAAHARAGC
jgi:hypothetical protein